MTSWILVIIVYGHSVSLSNIDNLKDLKECQRIQKVMEDRTSGIGKSMFCMETVNK